MYGAAGFDTCKMCVGLHNRCVGLQEQLVASQEALRAAKAESARRLKTLQSLQQQVHPSTPPLRWLHMLEGNLPCADVFDCNRLLSCSIYRLRRT